MQKPRIAWTPRSVGSTPQELRSRRAPRRRIWIESTKVRQYGNTIITNHNMMYTGPKVSSHVYVTMVWVKQAGGWQMVTRQATKLPQQ